MTWPAKLLIAVLAAPTPWGCPEDAPAREARLRSIVRVAIEVTAEPVPGWSHQQRTALLLAKLQAESGGYRLDVHDGSRRGDRGNSICLGQVMHGPWLSMSRAEWESLAGTDIAATRRCLTEVWRQLQMHRRMCASGAPTRRKVAALYSSYGTGKGCAVRPWGKVRARAWARMAGALHAKEAP